MGYRCPICKEDFANDKEKFENHIKICTGGGAKIVVDELRKETEKYLSARDWNEDEAKIAECEKIRDIYSERTIQRLDGELQTMEEYEKQERKEEKIIRC